MHRCFELAKLGESYVAPNPMVGAVLVYNDKIIGEAYHERYGEAHAEVNCLNSVREENKHLISESTLYVSLEPCAHYGKTPPCVDLIIKNKIPKVVISVKDNFDLVNGKGIQKLLENNVEVVTGILENEGNDFDSYILGLQRHIEANHPYSTINEILEVNKFLYVAGKNRVAFSQTDGTDINGMKTQSLSHGGFDDDIETINSIKFMLS